MLLPRGERFGRIGAPSAGTVVDLTAIGLSMPGSLSA
jgi:hypothetical protein